MSAAFSLDCDQPSSSISAVHPSIPWSQAPIEHSQLIHPLTHGSHCILSQLSLLHPLISPHRPTPSRICLSVRRLTSLPPSVDRSIVRSTRHVEPAARSAHHPARQAGCQRGGGEANRGEERYEQLHHQQLPSCNQPITQGLDGCCLEAHSLVHFASPTAPLPLCSFPYAERVSPWNFMFAVQRNPCFRQSFMWGIGVGAAMAGHSAIRHRQQRGRRHTWERRGELGRS